MPMVSPKADLLNNCNAPEAPFFIAKNGTGDIAEKRELYSLIEEGLDDVRQGRIKPADEVLASLRQKMGY